MSSAVTMTRRERHPPRPRSSRDRLPHAGEHLGLYHAMGYSGHGVQMSVHMGMAMATLIKGGRPDIPWLNAPWPPIPGYFGLSWFLPLFGVWQRFKGRCR
ncbi:FAD-dependent oxidoreductase [Halotalea alkalilenta]|uniref:FAD dependent oxidoreductase domain-containing protein n=1 Tax=Halotalea alkalilenta TaxID=376489 RepID=A0A172YDK2_9GAMM|nr:FAD-dependent oxidoreductase [Halotalea alkalilenta]ANF57350.1 hypothetical protein A5892_07640 [Halotalea alkalilenta]